MNFQNFYILIFKNNLNPKRFVYVFNYFIICVMITSFVLTVLDFNITNNDIIRNYQLSKIKQKSFNETETIIIGDSSAGNAIDATSFSLLTNQKTENLALTGSFGIYGSLGILQQSLKKNTNLKNIIIIHTLDIWPRNYAKESILELISLSEINEYLEFKDVFSYYLNPKELMWHLQYLFKKSKLQEIDLKNDYLKQNTIKYSNGRHIFNKNTSFNGLKISSDKLKEFYSLQNFCIKNSLNCIYMNGPILDQLAVHSNDYIQSLIGLQSKNIKINYIPKIFVYPKIMMGDNMDHIDNKYKHTVTEEYLSYLKPYLKY